MGPSIHKLIGNDYPSCPMIMSVSMIDDRPHFPKHRMARIFVTVNDSLEQPLTFERPRFNSNWHLKQCRWYTWRGNRVTSWFAETSIHLEDNHPCGYYLSSKLFLVVLTHRNWLLLSVHGEALRPRIRNVLRMSIELINLTRFGMREVRISVDDFI